MNSITPLTPKKLFLIDSLGALLSAFLLGVVLVKFESVFGMPPSVLYFLSAIALIFFIYSAFCFLRLRKNRPSYLRIIAFANLAYCLLTAALVVKFCGQLSFLGISYFVIEIMVVLFLVRLELQAARPDKR